MPSAPLRSFPLPDFLRYTPQALRFLSRLPVPHFAFEPEAAGAPDMEKVGPAMPVAGAFLGLIGALVLVLATFAGLGSFIAATLAIGALAAITGAFHEDGLADTADGLGGMSRERRLDIMRDSRIGTFGTVALILGFSLRIGALSALADLSLIHAAGALVAAQALARLAGLWILHSLPSARADGLAFDAGPPGLSSFRISAVVGLTLAALIVAPGFGIAALLAGLIAIAAVLAGLMRLARAQFGGQTGDVAGAAAVLSEIAFLIGLLILAQAG